MKHGKSVIRAPDRITAATRRLLRERVREQVEAGARQVILSCEATHSIDSCGLGLLCTLRRCLESYGGSLYLADLSDELRTLLHMTALDRILTVLDEDGQVPGSRGGSAAATPPPGPPPPHPGAEVESVSAPPLRNG